MFCLLRVYVVTGRIVDVGIMTVMGALDYLLRKFDFETAPVVLGLILAPMTEMSSSHGKNWDAVAISTRLSFKNSRTRMPRGSPPPSIRPAEWK
jgi:hypothetical protein